MANAKQVEFLRAGILDGSGDPLAAGLVYTYEAGTTTNKTAYADAEMTTPAANPFVLDAYGQGTLYCDGNYKFLIKTSAGVTVATLDNFEYSVPASANLTVTSVSTTYTATTSDDVLLCSTAGGAYSVTLPTAVGNSGKEYYIIKTTSDANVLTVDGNGSETIGGSTTREITDQHQVLGIVSDNSNYQMTSTPGVVTLTGTETLTNKTLTSPVLTTPTIASFANATHTHEASASGGSTIRLPRGGFDGLAVSHGADTEHDISIAVGECRDSTNAASMTLSSALVKRADAEWAVGSTNGGFAAGETLPASGTIHLWLIKRADTGVVDAMFNDHATSGLTPTLPTGYDYKRRIASFRTDGSNNILNMVFWGTGVRRRFIFKVPVLDINANNPGASAVTATLSVPGGINVIAINRSRVSNTGSGSNPYHWIFSPDQTDADPSATAVPFADGHSGSTTSIGFSHTQTITNTSSQVKYRLSASAAENTVYIFTDGWEDSL